MAPCSSRAHHVADTVNRYIELLANGSADELAALYTPDATVEDPVGSGVRRGHDDIRKLYSRFENQDRTVELLSLARHRRRGGVPGAADRHHRGDPHPYRRDRRDDVRRRGQDHVDAGVLVRATDHLPLGTNMPGFGVGIMNNTINSKYGPKPPIQADYLTAVACGADSFWVADHLNSVLPPSMWKPKYVGAAKMIPKMDAHLEPWTMLGYLAAKNNLRRMRLGVAVTDTGRRNPAVTAQAAATLHLLTRGRAVLGIGTGEKESNAPYGVDWSKPVARFEEALATIRALWNSNGELVTRDSPFFPLHNAPFALPPYKGKWPEIWVAAHGPRMIRATGRYADGWFPGTTGAVEYGEQLAALRRRRPRMRAATRMTSSPR